MADPSLYRLWSKVDAELRAALSELSAINPGADFEQTRQYLDHNELGLACESIEYVIAEDNLKSTTGVASHLSTARTLMGLSVEPAMKITDPGDGA